MSSGFICIWCRLNLLCIHKLQAVEFYLTLYNRQIQYFFIGEGNNLYCPTIGHPPLGVTHWSKTLCVDLYCF